MNSFHRLVIAFGLALLVTACGEKTEDPTKALAVINGKPITVGEFEHFWSQLPEYARQSYTGPDGRKKFLEELINRELLLQEAKRRGLDRDRTLTERVERFKERSLLEGLMNEEVSRVTVTQDEVKAFYSLHGDSFTRAEDAHVSHILVKTEAEAADLKKRIDQGEDFAALAKKTSLDLATRYKGGDLGVVKPGQMAPQFENALRRLKVGDVSVPVATQFGYHLIKVNSRTSGAPLSFDEAKEQIKDQILIQKKTKRFDELVATLRAKANLRVPDVPVPELPRNPAAAAP